MVAVDEQGRAPRWCTQLATAIYPRHAPAAQPPVCRPSGNDDACKLGRHDDTAANGRMDATRLLLDHPSAHPAAMLAMRNPGGADDRHRGDGHLC
jgi:hypothetical protein